MRLVEYSEASQNEQQQTNILAHNVKDEDYSATHTLQNLDTEMKNILSDNATDINQKWMLYREVLQRYLGFIKRIRQGDCKPVTNALTHAENEKSPSKCDLFNTVLNNSETTGLRSPTFGVSTPKNISISNLPIRIRKRILRHQQRAPKKKGMPARTTAVSSDTTSPTMSGMDDDDDDDDEYNDVYDDVMGSQLSDADDDSGSATVKTLTSSSGVVVNGWTKSNIKK